MARHGRRGRGTGARSPSARSGRGRGRSQGTAAYHRDRSRTPAPRKPSPPALKRRPAKKRKSEADVAPMKRPAESPPISSKRGRGRPALKSSAPRSSSPEPSVEPEKWFKGHKSNATRLKDEYSSMPLGGLLEVGHFDTVDGLAVLDSNPLIFMGSFVGVIASGYPACASSWR